MIKNYAGMHFRINTKLFCLLQSTKNILLQVHSLNKEISAVWHYWALETWHCTSQFSYKVVKKLHIGINTLEFTIVFLKFMSNGLRQSLS